MSLLFVFDLDGVIRHWDPAIVRTAEIENALPEGSLFGAAFQPELLLDVITGKISDATWREATVERLTVSFPEGRAASAVEAWSAPAGAIIAGSLEALAQARTCGTVCLLSNATDRLKPDLDELGITLAFDHIFNSSEIGFAKPDHRVFAHVEQVLNAEPATIVFIDDSAGNVAAAAERGWTSLLATPETPLSDLLEPFLVAVN